MHSLLSPFFELNCLLSDPAFCYQFFPSGHWARCATALWRSTLGLYGAQCSASPPSACSGLVAALVGHAESVELPALFGAQRAHWAALSQPHLTCRFSGDSWFVVASRLTSVLSCSSVESGGLASPSVFWAPWVKKPSFVHPGFSFPGSIVGLQPAIRSASGLSLVISLTKHVCATPLGTPAIWGGARPLPVVGRVSSSISGTRMHPTPLPQLPGLF